MATTFNTRTVTPGLTLVGVGPGDPELLTLKAIKALKNANVVLYDALIHPEILEYASPKALKRFVGDRAGLCSYSQEDINEMIVNYAFTYGQVVRLKGGDPFVFGRGYEEMLYAERFDIKTTVVPGITSATALPALKKIPLTTREHNESFWVLTGTTATQELSNDIFLAAQTKATAVILMGLKKLAEIVEIYKEAGKAHLPVAIIINGSLPDEHFITGLIDDIESRVNRECLHGQALIVVGEAIRYYLDKKEKAGYRSNLIPWARGISVE